jgi:hypothetical protein
VAALRASAGLGPRNVALLKGFLHLGELLQLPCHLKKGQRLPFFETETLVGVGDGRAVAVLDVELPLIDLLQEERQSGLGPAVNLGQGDEAAVHLHGGESFLRRQVRFPEQWDVFCSRRHDMVSFPK